VTQALRARHKSLRGRYPLGARDVVPVCVAREKTIARFTEAAPDRIGPALLHRTDRLPLGLQAPQFRRRLLPIGRLDERFRPHRKRLLLREVVRPQPFARDEILLTPCEEAIASRAEPVPDRLLAPARHRADRLPFGLHPFDLIGRLDPARGPGQRLGFFAESGLLREVLGANLGLGGEERLGADPDFVVRRLEAPP